MTEEKKKWHVDPSMTLAELAELICLELHAGKKIPALIYRFHEYNKAGFHHTFKVTVQLDKTEPIAYVGEDAHD